MSVVIGIDVGGSTTKIVGFENNGNILSPLCVKANDPITSVYGAFGKFADVYDLSLSEIKKIMITGVGATQIEKPIYGLECSVSPEFKCIGLGGMYVSGLDNAIIASLGTGTALVHAVKGKEPEYLGGTGVGGGTIVGLSKKMLGLDSIDHLDMMARNGIIDNVDLKIRDISKKDIGISGNMTASNFGNLSDIASNSDIALGIINMVFETIGMMSVFAARQYKIKDIVLTGNLIRISQSKSIFDYFNQMFDMNFIIPENARYSTVIGAALSGLKE